MENIESEVIVCKYESILSLICLKNPFLFPFLMIFKKYSSNNIKEFFTLTILCNGLMTLLLYVNCLWL